ncbi:MAG TPA: hypothetical protein VGG60_13795 [Candidatus Binataceae bacterium]|jgi:hypothetical protein
MTGRQIFGVLLTVLAICAFTAPMGAAAESQSLPLRVRVDSVLAANTDKGIDPALAVSGIGERLKTMFDYSTYHLVLHQELETVCGKQVTFELPGGRILQIAPHAIVQNMISMELVLFEGTRPLMTTDLRLINHAVLIVGGPKYERGMLITIITMGSNDLPDRPREHRRVPHPAMAAPAPGAADAAPLPPNNDSPPQQ